ncbi:MAG: ABC transporter permease subunit [Pirellulaceae bacterium]
MPHSSARLVRLCRKELRETLRDRRTIMTLVLMPLLVYPLLSMTLQRVLLSSNLEASPAFRVYVDDAGQAERLSTILEDPRSQPPSSIQDASEGQVADFDIFYESGASPRQTLLRKEVDVVVDWEEGPPFTITVTATRGELDSEQARRILLERIEWFNAAAARDRLAELEPEVLDKQIVSKTRTISGPTATPILATVVPLMLVLMTITGAVYPAIDLTAGERERGTIEAVIASPVSRASILFAKYVAVVTVAMMTAVIHLFAMFVTLWSGGLLEFLLGKDSPFPWLAILQILGLLVLFSGFFSAVLLALTSFARSFKEAQAYLIPLMLLSITPGIFSLLPGINLSGPLAIVPLVNIILLTRDLLAGTATAGPAVAAILSTIAYAAAALGVAARLFGSDAVLRGSELSLSSMFARPPKPRLLPTASEAALTLAILFPVYFVASNLGGNASTTPTVRQQDAFDQQPPESVVAPPELTSETIGKRMILNAIVLTVVIGGIPFLASRLSRDNTVATFRLHRPPWFSMFGALLMGLGLWAFVYEMMIFAEQIGIVGVDASKFESAVQLKDRMKELSPWLLLATFAATPGIIEELCFRGYLYSAFKKTLTPWRLILLTAALFGLFHVFTGSVLQIERFLPTTVVGIALGWVTWRSGSIFPCMLFHFTHDALLLMVARFEEWIQGRGIGSEESMHLPAIWLIGCGGLLVLGVGMVWFSTRKTK